LNSDVKSSSGVAIGGTIKFTSGGGGMLTVGCGGGGGIVSSPVARAGISLRMLT